MFYHGMQLRLTDLPKQLGVAALYALLLYVGERYFESEDLIGYFEPACGLALAVLLIGGKRYTWGILFGAILIQVMTNDSLGKAFVIASCDTMQALLGAWMLTRVGPFNLRLQSLNDYLRLILLGGCTSIVFGALAVNAIFLFSGWLSPYNYFQSLLRWWMSDTLGVILITPLILVWWQTKFAGYGARQVIESVLLIGLTLLVGQLVLIDWLHDFVGHVANNLWLFMLIIWVAMFLGARGATVAMIILAIQGLSGAIQGVGYYADDIAQTGLINYWFDMLTMSLVGMALATYINEIKQVKLVSAQRDVLIREIHHRIKNNLQGVTGLLRQFADRHPEITESVNQTIGQVQSIAAIHGLQERNPEGNVRLREMTVAVATAVGVLWQKPVAIEISPDWMPCGINEAEAVPLALILNELISNAIKHGGKFGEITIQLKPGDRPDSVRIAICNVGQMQPDFDLEHVTSTGLQLVRSLMPRTGAKLSWQQRGNTVAALLELAPPAISMEPEP